MNFLAHAYLSFEDPEILTGNMISDFVKGKKKFGYAMRIQEGISLHRQIDAFTDTHANTRLARRYFSEDYGLYSGAFVDIAYDHFLANDPLEFGDESRLAQFSQKAYAQLNHFRDVFPQPFQMMFGYMKKQDWLFNYRFREGIRNSFAGLVRRASFMHDHKKAFDLFETHHDQLQICYAGFFPELKSYSKKMFDLLNSGV